MADQHPFFPQGPVEGAALHPVGPGKQEVGPAVGEFKPAPGQLPGRPGPGFHDLLAGLVEIAGALQGRNAGGQGHPVDVVGVEAGADPFQVGNQALAADGKAQTGPGHLPGLGKGLDHQQVVAAVDQGDAALGPKVHIGLIHNHHVVGIGGGNSGNFLRRQGQAGGGVGVGNDDGLVPAVVFHRVQAEIRFQGNHVLRDVEQPAPDGIASIGHIGVGQGVGLIAEGPQGEKQIFVAAVARHHLVRLDAVIPGRSLPQGGAGGVGVQLQPARLALNGLHHRGGGGIGAFVGVQFDIRAILGLFTGGVGLQMGQGGAEITAHFAPPPSAS